MVYSPQLLNSTVRNNNNNINKNKQTNKHVLPFPATGIEIIDPDVSINSVFTIRALDFVAHFVCASLVS